MNKIKIGLVALATLTLSSCDSWLDVNTDPNYPSDIPTVMPLTSGIGSAANIIGGQYAILGALWAQHFTQTNTANQYKDWDAYNVNSKLMNSEYMKMYANSMYDFKKAIQRSEVAGDWNIYLMATVMDVYCYQVMADLYEKIPYSEACRADEGLVNPKFDEGQAIYTDLLVRLDAALAKDFSASGCTDPKANDLVFGGNMQSWKEFANTLKLKLAIRQFKAKTDESTKVINDMLNSGAAFLGKNAEVAGYKDSPGNYNPLYDSEVHGLGNANLSASNTTLNFIKGSNDPRLPFMYVKGNKGDYQGLDQGDYTKPAADQPTGSLSKGQIKAGDPVIFISAAESSFLQAEALLKCKAGVGAKDKYEEGVRRAFARYGIESEAGKLMEAGAAYEYTPDNALRSIITQKWLSMFISQGLESFFEFNRTGFPSEFTVSKQSILTDKEAFVQRLVFPEYELISNKENTPERINPDVKLWWTK